MDTDDLTVGARYFRWWDSGALGPEQMVVTLLKVNRVTVRVKNRYRDKPVLIHLTYFLANYQPDESEDEGA